MTRRVAENQVARSLLGRVQSNRVKMEKYAQEISTGLKASTPGDTPRPATINQYQLMLSRVESFQTLISSSRGVFQFQDDSMNEAHSLLTRAQELAMQGANETNTEEERSQIAIEVFEIREALVQLANSTYQGKYVWNGTITNSPPFNPQTYATPATGPASVRYVFDATAIGATTEQSVSVSDSVAVRLNSSADGIWANAIGAVERLGRALDGWQSLPAPPALPDGTGAAWTFPQDRTVQTQAIAQTIDLLKSAREQDIQVERVSLGGRLERLTVAESLLSLGKDTAQRVISELSEADVTESATKLSLAQTGLEASLTLTSRLLNLSVLDYL